MEVEVSNIAPPKVQEPPKKVVDITIELSHGKFVMDNAFELRTHAVEVSKASEAIWGDMSKEHQEVVTQIFKRSLEVMHQKVDRYLPYVITGAPGDMIDISVKVLLSKIGEQVEIIKQANEFERDTAKREMIAAITGNLMSEDDEDFLDHMRASLKHGVQVPNEAVQRLMDMISQDS